MVRRKFFPAAVCLFCCLVLFACRTPEPGPLKLTENGQSCLGILPPEKATEMELLAVRELQTYLKRSTGADFRTGPSTGGNIILRRSEALAPEESAISIAGNDLILEGGDEWGVLYAVYCFLENQIGIRWFSPYGHEKVPSNPDLILHFPAYRQKPAYTDRGLIGSNYYKFPDSSMFFLRNRLNIDNALSNPVWPGSKPKTRMKGWHCHTLFTYIPPEKGETSRSSKFMAEKSYFKEHPEFFSMSEKGERVSTMQLCFSNPALREEFTRRFLEYAEKTGGDGVYSISAQDWPGAFCCCPECRAMEKKYRCTAGPLLDFLLELCPKMKEKFPEAWISTLAYRKEQSEDPPVLLEGKKLPDNFLCVFAPIDDDFSKPLDHENNRSTLENLKKWTVLSSRLWVWYYPIVYGTVLPTGCMARSMKDTRLLYEAGARGTYFEHDSGGIFAGLNFGDMMTWMFLKLFQDPFADVQTLRKEFCDFYYGAAADDMISYMDELDSLTEKEKTFRNWDSGAISRIFTPDNLLRWEMLFDKMETETYGDPETRKRVQDARISLDLALLRHYKEAKKSFPSYIPSADNLEQRIRNSLTDSVSRRVPESIAWLRKNWLAGPLELLSTAYIHATCEPKELPPPLDEVDSAKIRQVIAVKVNGCGFEKTQSAAFGQAIYDDKAKAPEIPFPCGFYDNYGKRFLLNQKITKEEIVPDRYALYKVGEAPLPPKSTLWTGSSWRASIDLSELFTPGEAPDKLYEIWISLKFEGPAYSPESKAKENRVWIDRAVVVEKDR